MLTLDPDVQKAALHIINNLVCGPHSRGIGRMVPGISRKKSTGKGGEDLLSKMWGLVRANNGIMVSDRIVWVWTSDTFYHSKYFKHALMFYNESFVLGDILKVQL